MGLRGCTPMNCCISSSRTEAFDVLPKACVSPYCDEERAGKADNLSYFISKLLWITMVEVPLRP